MTTIEITNYKNRVAQLIDDRRLRQAIKELKEKSQQQMAWEVGDRLERIEQAYNYMLRYVAQGVNDPERGEVYAGIVGDMYSILDQLVHFMSTVVSPTQYYSILRFYRRAPMVERITTLIKQYQQSQADLSLYLLVPENEVNTKQTEERKRAEALQKEVFEAVWVEPHLSNADEECLSVALRSEEFSSEFKSHILSALTLGLMQTFDPARMALLMQAYSDGKNVKLRAIAMVGLLFGLWLYRNRPLPKKLKVRLDAIKDHDDWASDLRTACIEMIRTTDTERINKKIRDEVIPEMMNLRPEIMDKIRGGEINPQDMASLDANPEWQKMLDKNGLTDKLKELTEMQMEGGDVMMSTFSHLKNFPFFSDIPNWFLPFSSSHTAVQASALKLGVVGDMIENAHFLCDSDKYSFIFALDMVPQQQRDMMTSQFKAQSDGIYQQMGDRQEGTRPDAMKRAINSYLQNVYRFFKLYRRKDEFVDPFGKGINLISIPALANDFDDADLLEMVAEFYFKLSYMGDALAVFEKLEKIMPGDSARYQKMGYAYENLKDWANAIKKYQVAELLDTDSTWTTRRLAACYRAVGDNENALKYYRQLQSKLPDDLNTALVLGYVMLELNRIDEAVQQFYKVEFLDEKSTKAWRPLAWTLFLQGKYDEANSYYNKIIQSGATATDYLNMGHVAMALGDLRDAINFYKLSIDASSAEAFGKEMAKDRHHLLEAGVDPMLLPIILDAVSSD